MDGIDFSFVPQISKIPRYEWDAVASRYGNPFLSWGFLALLEESGSIQESTGWVPAHLVAKRSGHIVALAPFYLRTHSWGDFVFDFSLAEFAQGIGARYYPKLVGVIPLTPAPVWRIMVAAREDEKSLVAAMLRFASETARRMGAGGVHLLWVDPDFEALVSGAAFSEWRHQRYLWTDAGYGDFPGLLASFSKNMRRNVMRERASLADAGITRRVLQPDDVSPSMLERMADYYERTNDRFGPWAAKFLTRDFFIRLSEFMPSGWIFSAAFSRDNERDPIAIALVFEGADSLYGRYWGCERDIPNLHFELCYYQSLEYALASGITKFDPGMGGSHKARRGFRAGLCSSFHCIHDGRVASALENALAGANEAEASLVAALNEDLPFRKIKPRMDANGRE